MRNRNKRVVSTGLALSMLLSMIPLHTMAAEPGNTQAGYKDPWNASASIPVLEKKDAITSPTFTYKEWTGEDGNEDVFAVNREEASMFATSSVIYDSVDAALDSAINFNKEASGYVQYLTGKNDADWSLRVVKNDTIAKESYANFYEIQAAEERDHALIFRNYLHDNGMKVKLSAPSEVNDLLKAADYEKLCQ